MTGRGATFMAASDIVGPGAIALTRMFYRPRARDRLVYDTTPVRARLRAGGAPQGGVYSPMSDAG
jgi:hypothetical protein